MKKALVFVALTIAALGASAQQACLPLDLGGPGTRMVLSSNDAGVAVGWWCPGLTDPKLSLHAVRWSALTADLYGRIAAIGASSDKLAAIEQVRADSATTRLADLRDVWDPLRFDLIETRPPPSSWAVARNATYPTRPAYPLVDGARGSTSNGRVAVGATCDCRALGIVEGSSTYCAVAPAQVALCSRIP